MADIGAAIEAAVMKRANAGLQAAAKQISAEMWDASIRSMTEFYGSYAPRMYGRSGQLMNAFDEPVITTGSNEAEITMLVKPENVGMYDSCVPGSGWNASGEWVFDRVWTKGVHGWMPYQYTPYQNWMGRVRQPAGPSVIPGDKMDEYFNELCGRIPSIVDGAVGI